MNSQATGDQPPATGFLRGLNHLTLAVSELQRSVDFYETVLGCSLVSRWSEGAYLLAGSLWLALIVDPETRKGPLPEYTHVAFDIAPEHFKAFSERLIQAEVKIWKDNLSEGDSLYVLDPDGHKLEIHATDLRSRLLAKRAAAKEGYQILIQPEDLP